MREGKGNTPRVRSRKKLGESADGDRRLKEDLEVSNLTNFLPGQQEGDFKNRRMGPRL